MRKHTVYELVRDCVFQCAKRNHDLREDLVSIEECRRQRYKALYLNATYFVSVFATHEKGFSKDSRRLDWPHAGCLIRAL